MKYCNKCKQNKDDADFHKQSRNKDGLQSVCKSCRKELDRLWYKSSPKKKESNQKYYETIRDEVNCYKAACGCKYCGENEPAVLDFHHVNGDKEFSIGTSVGYRNKEVIFAEIKKCVVVCANCHRRIHAGLINDCLVV